MSQEVSSFKKLVVWQKSVTLAIDIYATTSSFPKEEKYGLISQMQRAAVSIASNIAEGSGRGGKKEYAQFIHIAIGSACELETQLEIALKIGFLSELSYTVSTQNLVEIKMMLTSLRHSLLR